MESRILNSRSWMSPSRLPLPLVAAAGLLINVVFPAAPVANGALLPSPGRLPPGSRLIHRLAHPTVRFLPADAGGEWRPSNFGRSITHTYGSARPERSRRFAMNAGGMSWLVASPQGYGPHNPIDAADCPSPSLCVVASIEGDISVSNDPTGGPQSWTPYLAPQSAIYLSSLSCATVHFCVAGLQGGLLLSFDPSGDASSWVETQLPSNGPICAATSTGSVVCGPPVFCSPVICMVGGEGAVFSLTNPGSGTSGWVETAIPGMYGVQTITCHRTDLCVAVDTQSTLATTRDPAGGSAAWKVTPLSTGMPYLNAAGVSCATATLCVAIQEGVLGLERVYWSTTPTDPYTWKWFSVAPKGSQPFEQSGRRSSRGRARSRPAFVASLEDAGTVSCPAVNWCQGVDLWGDLLTSTNPTGGKTAWTMSSLDLVEHHRIRCISQERCIALDGAIRGDAQETGNVLVGGPPSGYKLAGHIGFRLPAGAPAPRIPVVVDGPQGKTTLSTDGQGNYSTHLPPGTYTVSLQPDLSPQPLPSQDCTRSGANCIVHLDQDRVNVNFDIKCVDTIDFHTSMIATGCFVPQDVKAKTWKAIGPFRMNGIDFQSPDDQADPVVFDPELDTVAGNEVKMWLESPGWEGKWFASYVPGGLHQTFNSDTESFVLPLQPVTDFFQFGIKAGVLSVLGGGTTSALFGWPHHTSTLQVQMTSGKTTLKLQLSFPRETDVIIDPVTGVFRSPGRSAESYPNRIDATVTATNANGIESIEGGFSPAAIWGPTVASGGLTFDPGKGGWDTLPKPAPDAWSIARLGFKDDLVNGVMHLLGTFYFSASAPPAPYLKTNDYLFFGVPTRTVDAAWAWAHNPAGQWPYGLGMALIHLGLSSNNLNRPIADTGFFLQRWGIHFGLDVNQPDWPWQLGGSVGFSFLPHFNMKYVPIHEVLALDGDASIDLNPVRVDSKQEAVLLDGVQIGDGHLAYQYPNIDFTGHMGVDLQKIFNGWCGNVHLLQCKFPFPLSIDGSARLSGGGKEGWVWDVQGQENLWGLTGAAQMLVNENGAGVCLTMQGYPRGLYYGNDFHWHWGGCSDGPWSPLAPGLARDRVPGRASGKAGSDATAVGFTVKPGSPFDGVAVTGAGGAPIIRLEGPGGMSLEIPAGQTEVTTASGTMVSDPGDATTYILLSRPPAGRYDIVPETGSPAFAKVRFSSRLPPPSVTVNVTPAGCERRLTWTLRPESGQEVTFSESGVHGPHPLITTDAATGSILFMPEPGGPADRQIVALVEEQNTPRTEMQLGSYTVAAGDTPGPVSGLQATFSGSDLKASWSAVCAAAGYAAAVTVGKTTQELTPSEPSLSANVGSAKQANIAVAAVGPLGSPGSTSSISIQR